MADSATFEQALTETPGFVYSNGPRLVLLSAAWVLASIPVVTIGPATLAAYRAILDLRSDRNRIDRGAIASVLRRSGLAATLLSGLPVVFGAIAVSYALGSIQTGSLLGEILALSAGYAAMYLSLVLMPAFFAMARGRSDVEALKFGVAWTASHPTAALATGLLTLVVMVVTALLTIGFVLLFAGVAFSLQIAVIELTSEDADGTAPTPTANGAGQ